MMHRESLGSLDTPRVCSLLSSATEMLFGMGAGGQVVGISHECDYPPEALHLPRVSHTHVDSQATSLAIDSQVRELMIAGEPLYGLRREAIVALRPEVIVTQSQCDVCAVRYDDVVELVTQSEALRGCRIVDLNPHSLDEMLSDIERIGQAIERAQSARDYAARLRERVERVALRTRGLTEAERPRVACLEWIDPLMVAGNWMPQLIDLAGGRQSLTRAGQHSPYVTWQEVVAFRPEVVIVMPCGFDLQRSQAEAARLARLPSWADLPAVRQGRVFAVDANAYFNRSGPRLVQSLELLAWLAQPKLFADCDRLAETDRFFARVAPTTGA